MEFGVELTQVIAWLRNRWYERSTLLIVAAASALVWLWLLVGIPARAISGEQLALLIPILGMSATLWWGTSRLPHAPENTVGVAVAITTETEAEQKQLSRDFVQTLRTLLRPSGKPEFYVLEVPDYFAARTKTKADAEALLFAARCRFMLFGTARLRRFEGKQRHVLDMHGIVAHRPVPEDTYIALVKEFTEVLPARSQIPVESDLLGFEITSDLVSVAAKYIIGLASFLSGDAEYAQVLFEDLRLSIGPLNSQVPALRKIRERLPKRLCEAYLAQAEGAYADWRKTRAPEQLVKVGQFAEHACRNESSSYKGHLLMAIFYFADQHDLQKARAELRQCKEGSNSVWALNDAFLLACAGDLPAALAKYKKAFRRDPDPSAIIEAEEFICWVLEKEPRVQLYFCLGLINYYGKHDLESAERDFRLFVGAPASHAWPAIQAVAQQHLSQIRAEKLRTVPVRRVEESAPLY
jgi:tetratricopeptide (TPR) repeat protein